MTPPGRKPLHGEDGFVLIEILVSALVVAIVAAGGLQCCRQTRAPPERTGSARRHSRWPRKTRRGCERCASPTQPPADQTEGNHAQRHQIRSTFDWRLRQRQNRNLVLLTRIEFRRLLRIGSSRLESHERPAARGDPEHRRPLQRLARPQPRHADFSVLNSLEKPIPGVSLTGAGPSSFGGTTDEAGCATFPDLAAGSYTVTPSGAVTGMVARTATRRPRCRPASRRKSRLPRNSTTTCRGKSKKSPSRPSRLQPDR